MWLLGRLTVKESCQVVYSFSVVVVVLPLMDREGPIHSGQYIVSREKLGVHQVPEIATTTEF